MRRTLLLMLLLSPLLAACGSTAGSRQMNALQSAQYDWSAAIRWGDFEGALNLVDPEVRRQRPTSELELARYQQVQISAYHELGQQVGADGLDARREVRIGVVNRHTMAERNVRYTEQWRYDSQAGRWWITSGLPDFWAGE